MQNIDPNTKISRSLSYLDTPLDDESIVMQIDSGDIYGMGDTAKTIWDMIAQPLTFAGVVENLIKEYKVDRQNCENGTSRFLREMENIGLVVISIQP